LKTGGVAGIMSGGRKIVKGGRKMWGEQQEKNGGRTLMAEHQAPGKQLRGCQQPGVLPRKRITERDRGREIRPFRVTEDRGSRAGRKFTAAPSTSKDESGGTVDKKKKWSFDAQMGTFVHGGPA